MPTKRHSDAEQLAAFVDGQLDGEELQEVSAHITTCEECRALIAQAALFEQEEAAQRAPRRGAWWAVAAAVVVVVAALPFARGYWYQRKITQDRQELFAAQKDSRVLAGRYAGEPYHGKHSATRGNAKNPDNVVDEKETAIELAALTLREDAAHLSSPAALRARALAEAIDKQPDVALQTISSIPESKRDAATWNDIAVIALAANKVPEALAAVNRALQLQPKMPEALFTRWQILHTREAAERYLAVDSSSPWANEVQSWLSFQ